MAEFRAPRTWHIESRGGYFYATDQFGGFRRYRSKAEAAEVIELSIDAHEGDAWHPGEVR